MKALLVGAGGMGRVWGKTLGDHADVELAAWVDIRPDAAALAVEELKLTNVFTGTDMHKAIASVQPDFVVDVTPPEIHREVTLAALAAGLPVLGEKPLSDTLEHAREMVTASEKAGQLYMVSQNRRFDPRIAAFKGLLSNIGKPEILNADFYIGAHFEGFRKEMPSPLLLDMSIHTFDAARYISGADAVSVYCEEFNPTWSWWKHDACATALFEMTGGLRYTYRGSWCSDGRHTSWESEWRAVGPLGSATWDGDQQIIADIVDAPGEGLFVGTKPLHVTPDSTDFASGVAGSLREFLRALKTNTTPMCECHDNFKSLAMVFAAIESAATGRRVPVAQN
ncbi:MAG: Gfo/Idh/MocA family oxidoreductase [Anaerolineae bacterium]|nr:Gfo/Idh/MocA family oxidoreductase [Anaerolineae bacterium]